jgi:hypothetical protein
MDKAGSTAAQRTRRPLPDEASVAVGLVFDIKPELTCRSPFAEIVQISVLIQHVAHLGPSVTHVPIAAPIGALIVNGTPEFRITSADLHLVRLDRERFRFHRGGDRSRI